jgi:hypothetical protein
MWVPPEEKDPIVLHAPTKKSMSLFGAVKRKDLLLFWIMRDITIPYFSSHGFIKIGKESLSSFYHHIALN